VAFMSRTFNACEKRYPAIEKEATAIIECVRHWQHLLNGGILARTSDLLDSEGSDIKSKISFFENLGGPHWP